MISQKTKQKLFTVGIAGTGVLSLILLIGFVTAQVKLVQFLKPRNAPSAITHSRVSKQREEVRSPKNKRLFDSSPKDPDTSGAKSPKPSRLNKSGPGTQDTSPSPAGRRIPQSPLDDPIPGINAPVGLNSPVQSSSVVSGDERTPSHSPSRKTPKAYTPPARSWTKPHVPYKRYKKGEQPPWARPTKQVIELRENDPDFDLTEELSRRRQEIIKSQEDK